MVPAETLLTTEPPAAPARATGAENAPALDPDVGQFILRVIAPLLMARLEAETTVEGEVGTGATSAPVMETTQ